MGCAEPEEEWFQLYSKLKTASLKIKISMTCIYKEHVIKTKKSKGAMTTTKSKVFTGL